MPSTFPALILEPGKRAVLIGPSGSGKTTLLHLLAGILEPSQSVEVDSNRLDKMGDADRRAFRIQRLGLVFQDFQLLEYLNVTDNILLPFRLAHSIGSEIRKSQKSRLEQLAEALKLTHKLKSKVTELSHGEQQRVSLCRSLITEPRVILADEPTGSLDPAMKELAIEQLFEHSGPGKATLVLATHDYSWLDRFDQVIELNSSASSATNEVS
jgi:putative ABC transport system ATP-binding protein